MMRLVVLASFAGLAVAHLNASEHDHDHDHHCGTYTDEENQAEGQRIAERLLEQVCSHKDLGFKIRACQPLEERAKRPVIIDTWYHIIHNGGASNLNPTQIQAQFNQVNKDFSGREDPNNPGALMDISFRFAGSTSTNNPTWFPNMEPYDATIKNALARDNRRNFNQYFGGLNGLLGYCYYPNSFPETSTRHGCMNLWSSIPGGSSTNYNEGKTTTHETGHAIGLQHTFQGGCNGGDGVSDTCNQASPTSGCPASRTSCNRPTCPDPIHNYMDYSYDRCMREFTRGQNTRANAQLFAFRPSLYNTEEEMAAIKAVFPNAWDEAQAHQVENEKQHIARRKAMGFEE